MEQENITHNLDHGRFFTIGLYVVLVFLAFWLASAMRCFLLNRSECLLRQPPRTIDVIECVACLLLRRMPTSHLKKNVCRLKKKYTVSCPTSHLKKKHADSVADSTTRQRLSGSLETVSAGSASGYSKESLLPSSSLRGNANPMPWTPFLQRFCSCSSFSWPGGWVISALALLAAVSTVSGSCADEPRDGSRTSRHLAGCAPACALARLGPAVPTSLPVGAAMGFSCDPDPDAKVCHHLTRNGCSSRIAILGPGIPTSLPVGRRHCQWRLQRGWGRGNSPFPRRRDYYTPRSNPPPHFPQLQLWSETPSSILFLHFSVQLWSELLHNLGLLQLWSELLRQQLALALPARGFSCELERRQRLALALPARGSWCVLLALRALRFLRLFLACWRIFWRLLFFRALPAPGFWRGFLVCTMGHDKYCS